MIRILLAGLALALLASLAAADDAVVLDSSSYWRTHDTMMQPVWVKAGVVTKMPLNTFGCRNAWVQFLPTALPAKDWTSADFDDSAWLRLAGLMVASTTKDSDAKSPIVGLEALRGKFSVTDPAAADLHLAVEYRGGIVAYLNGTEFARAHLAKPSAADTLADPTDAGEKPPRRLDVAVPANLLRKGVNVLALECHRAPYLETEMVVNEKKWPQGITFARASCGIDSIRLTAPAAALKSLTPNAGRPEGFQVWNSNAAAADFDMDYGDPNEALRPIEIVGTRNGTFSGKVVVGSSSPIKGLKAAASDLVSADGKSRIPASRILVRYAMPDGIEAYAETRYLSSWGARLGLDPEFPRSYTRAAITPPEVLGALLESPPAEVPVRTKSNKSKNAPTGASPIFGAVSGVWLTVTIPPDAAPGEYAGTLTIAADVADAADLADVAHPPSGASSPPPEEKKGPHPGAGAPHKKLFSVPVRLRVAGWKLPDPDKFRAFIEVVESPESLAIAYNVPLWSDRHFQLIESAFRHVRPLGGRVVYLPIICQTNMGNAESLVRWKKNAAGGFDVDFSVFDRYLDAVEHGQGKPEVVCIYAWDSFLDRLLGGRLDEKWEPGDQKKAIAELKGHGPDMTLVDGATGETSTREMPPYTDPAGAAAWAPVAEGILKRLDKRGWRGAAVLGLMCDYMPTKECALGMAKIFPDVPWASVAHHWPRPLYGIPITYKANVFADSDRYCLDPSERRLAGWSNPEREFRFLRLAREYFPLSTFRLMEEMSLMQGYRGVVRLGADFWPVLKNRRGESVGSIAGRYPKSFWNNLNIEVNLLAEGPDGPVATARFEAVREGIEECEARIVVERALADKDLRKKLGEEFASKLQSMLDERSREVRHGTSTFVASGHYVQWCFTPENWWQSPGVAGHYYFVGSSWQTRASDLFAAAGEVERKTSAATH